MKPQCNAAVRCCAWLDHVMRNPSNASVIVCLVILAYLKLIGDDAVKVRSINWLATVNAYALGAMIFNALVKPRRKQTDSDILRDVNEDKQ